MAVFTGVNVAEPVHIGHTLPELIWLAGCITGLTAFNTFLLCTAGM